MVNIRLYTIYAMFNYLILLELQVKKIEGRYGSKTLLYLNLELGGLLLNLGNCRVLPRPQFPVIFLNISI